MDEDALRAALSKSYDAIDTVNGLEADLIQSINETRKCVNDSRRELDVIRRNRSALLPTSPYLKKPSIRPDNHQ
jgi:hypothetical protein